jgi:hypothetical protein
MTYDLYEPAVEIAELPGEYCPSVDNDPPHEPKPPYKPIWHVRRTEAGKTHFLPGKRIHTGFSIYGFKWAGVETVLSSYEPCLTVTQTSVATLFRYLRKQARNAHH